MQVKIHEFHQLLSKGGLKGAAKLLNKCFDVPTTSKLGECERRFMRSNNGKDVYASNGVAKDGSPHNKNLNKIVLTNVQSPSNSTSEAMIYRNTIPKRTSSSSEEEDMEVEFNFIHESVPIIDCPIDCVVDEPVPSTSTSRGHSSGASKHTPLTIEECTNQVIKDVEAAKTRIFPPAGKDNFQFSRVNQKKSNELTAHIDDDYLVIGSHIDEMIQLKIVKGEYIDFSKLIPCDKIVNDDTRLELVMKNGHTFWSPVADSITINSFAHWEQAFRIYSNVYMRYHLTRSSELIQYNHIIHTIALTYVWDNVYAYDKEFRMHMSNHPERNWVIILQQAWSMKLCDRIF